jgi:hypothetical protein
MNSEGLEEVSEDTYSDKFPLMLIEGGRTMSSTDIGRKDPHRNERVLLSNIQL